MTASRTYEFVTRLHVNVPSHVSLATIPFPPRLRCLEITCARRKDICLPPRAPDGLTSLKLPCDVPLRVTPWLQQLSTSLKKLSLGSALTRDLGAAERAFLRDDHLCVLTHLTVYMHAKSPDWPLVDLFLQRHAAQLVSLSADLGPLTHGTTFPRLRKLRVCSTEADEARSFILSCPALDRLALHCSGVRQLLSLPQVRATLVAGSADDDSIDALIPCTRLEELAFGAAHDPHHVAALLPRLTTLAVRTGLGTLCSVASGLSLSRLSDLTFAVTPDASLRQPTQHPLHLPSLLSVSVWCEGDSTLRDVAQQVCFVAASAPRLRSVCLSLARLQQSASQEIARLLQELSARGVEEVTVHGDVSRSLTTEARRFLWMRVIVAQKDTPQSEEADDGEENVFVYF